MVSRCWAGHGSDAEKTETNSENKLSPVHRAGQVGCCTCADLAQCPPDRRRRNRTNTLSSTCGSSRMAPASAWQSTKRGVLAERNEPMTPAIPNNFSIEPGTVLSCLFPLDETPHVPGPKARPALVLAVRSARIVEVFVAYGTGKRGGRDNRVYLNVTDAESQRRSGLNRPTHFCLLRLRRLPLTQEFFAFSSDHTPVLGHLPSELANKLTHRLAHVSQDFAPDGTMNRIDWRRSGRFPGRSWISCCVSGAQPAHADIDAIPATGLSAMRCAPDPAMPTLVRSCNSATFRTSRTAHSGHS